MMKSVKLMKLILLFGIASGLFAAQAGKSAAQADANRNAYVEIEFDNLADFRKWSEPDPEECLGELKEEVEEIESIVEEVLSIVDALELETCPVTLLYQSGVPYLLTESGRYCLAEDLTVTCSATGITIEGSGITLDLNSHSIILTCTGAVGVDLVGTSTTNPINDITIKNGTVVGVNDYVLNTTGISLKDTADVRIEDVALTNLNFGIFVEDAVGTVINNAACHNNHFDIATDDDSATTITNSTFFGSDNGISYNDSHNMIVRDCSFSGLGSAILWHAGVLDVAEFDNCMVSDCSDHGFNLSNVSSVVVRNCSSSSNAGRGFYLAGSHDVVFRDCYASDNGDSSDGPIHSGFKIENSPDVCLYNCFSQNNTDKGFSVVCSSGLLARNCTATYNGNYGFTDDNDNTNQYYANYACNNGGPIALPNLSHNYNNILFASVTSPDNTRGVHNVDCSNSAVDQINAIESIVEDISVDVKEVCSCSLIEAIVIEIDEQLFALSSAVDELAETADDCSVKIVRNLPTQTLFSSGRYCLAEDVHGTIIIAANSIILDLNGHTIHDSGGVGIDMVGTSTTNPLYDINIKNGSLVGSLVGIVAEFVNALRIEDISCTNCEIGIFLENVDDVLLSNVVSYSNFVGLDLANVTDLLAQSCLFNDNKVAGVAAGGLGYNIGLFSSEFVNCIANSNGVGFGFAVSSNVVLRDCFASHNHGHYLPAAGFLIFERSMNICLYDCYAKSNFAGFVVDQTSTVLMRNCTAINNTDFGFFDGAGTNQYYANYACNNTGGNYSGVNSAPVTSPRNARDFSNVDCNNSDVDQIAAIFDCKVPCE